MCPDRGRYVNIYKQTSNEEIHIASCILVTTDYLLFTETCVNISDIYHVGGWRMRYKLL